MNKFTEIEQFRHVIKNVGYMYTYASKLPTFSYTGTVKLHGTNCGIDRVNGVIKLQSRNHLISVDCDNAGFAKFIAEIQKTRPGAINELLDKISSDPNNNVTLYGEWIGEGIQSKVAINGLPKQWVIFAAKLNGEYIDIDSMWNIESANIFNIKRIAPFHVEIDFDQPRNVIEKLNELTLQIEEECPWAKQFGVVGTGEGIVWKCDEFPNNQRLWFKTKGLKHKNDKNKTTITVDPVHAANIKACTTLVLPEWRLEQGFEHLREKNLDIDIKNLGVYLQWINKDVKKEESDTIAASGFEWKEVVKQINVNAKTYFLEKIKKEQI